MSTITGVPVHTFADPRVTGEQCQAGRWVYPVDVWFEDVRQMPARGMTCPICEGSLTRPVPQPDGRIVLAGEHIGDGIYEAIMAPLPVDRTALFCVPCLLHFTTPKETR